MWINDEVDLPQALIIAQREGRLVIFAGAGVSMGAPSNLPSFEDLATAVAQGVLPRKTGEPLDAFLGRVEQHGVDIQTRTRNIIDVPTSTPRDLHHSIVKLFRDPKKPLVGYLSKPNAYRSCDSALFDTLCRLHNAKGDALTLEDIERSNVLPKETVFYAAPLSTTAPL